VVPFEGLVPGQLEVACHQVPRSSRGVAAFFRVFSAAMRSVASVERALFVVGAPKGLDPEVFRFAAISD